MLKRIAVVFGLGVLCSGFAQTEPDLRGNKYADDGYIQTGSGYHSITGRISRVVDDIVVPGSVGHYPLVLSRVLQNRVKDAISNPTVPSYNEEAGISAKWVFNDGSYLVRIEDGYYPATQNDGVFVTYPDGSEEHIATYPQSNTVYTVGRGDRVYIGANLKVTKLVLQDGGIVYFRDFNTATQRYWPTDSIVDPYGLRTTYTIGTNSAGKVTNTMTDASGRWIRQTYDSDSNGSWTISADSSNGEHVDYRWDKTIPIGLRVPVNCDKLMEVSYSDGTKATYQYKSNVHGVLPYRCYDTRARSKMQSVEYEFDQTYSFWQSVYYDETLALFPLKTERVPGSSIALSTRSEFATGAAWGIGVKETKADGSVRTIVPGSAYNSGPPFSGRVRISTDYLGNSTTTIYGDGQTVPTTVTDPLGRVTKTLNCYVGPNSIRDIIENPKVVTYADGSKTTFTYSDSASPNYLSSQTDPLGFVTTYTRDANHRITSVLFPDGSTEAWTYNNYNQPLTHTLKNGNQESYTYDTRGLLQKRTLANGAVYTFTYYTQGSPWYDRLKSITDPNLNTTTYEFDYAFVNGIQSSTPVVGRGRMTKAINPDLTSRSIVYDIYGNTLKQTDENGNSTQYTYDVFNRVLTVADPLGNISRRVYASAQGIESNYTDDLPILTISPTGKVTKYTYDANMRIISAIVGYGTSDASETRTQYDAVGNVLTTKVQMASGANPTFRTNAFTYDKLNRKLTQTDALSRVTQYLYDANGNLLKTTFPDNSSVSATFDSMGRTLNSTDEMGRVSTFVYYPSGKTRWFIDPNSNSYSYWYDQIDRPTYLWYTNKGQTGFDFELTSYDNVGNIVSFQNRSGKVKTMAYDNRNRLTSSTWNDGITASTATTYDAAGRVLTQISGISSVAYSYNLAGQVLSETQSISGISPKTISYSYDGDGNRTAIGTNGYLIFYNYNKRSQLSSINYSNGSYVASYGYNVDGTISGRTLANGVATSYSYDLGGRVTGYSVSNGAGLIAAETYGYSLRDRKIWSKRANGRGDVFGYQADGQLNNFVFDALNPDTAPNGSSESIQYSYDGNGNRTNVTRNGIASIYSPDHANQYSSITGLAISYSDGRGNANTLGASTFVYDAENRMIQATNGATTTNFYYDSKGRNVKRVTKGVATYYTFDGMQVLETFDSSENITSAYIWGSRVDEVLNDWTPARSYHYHVQNCMGSTIAVTSTSGTVLERYLYDAFGNTKFFDASGNSISGSLNGTSYLFTGQEYISTFKIYNYKNRFYSPEMGRFVQCDPLRLDAKDLNFYRYCGNDPVNNSDPLGLTHRDDTGVAARDQEIVPQSFIDGDSDDSKDENKWTNGSQRRVVSTSILQVDKNGDPVFIPEGEPYKPNPKRAGEALLQRGKLITRNGFPLPAIKNLSDNIAWDCDCHGFTVTGGKFWIDNDDMQNLLTTQTFLARNPVVIPTQTPQKGDWVVYSNSQGAVRHSGVISSPGMITMAAGTWVYPGNSKTTTLPINEGWPYLGTTIRFWTTR